MTQLESLDATLPLQGPVDSQAIQEVIAALQRDYSKLAARIRTLDHNITCSCAGTVLRLNYPSLRQSTATVEELVDVLVHYLTQFALPRSQISAVMEQYGKVDVQDFSIKISQLFQTALNLFKRANQATNRNGEAGELILFILTEWLLQAPQLIAKMALKTNPQMPVHGADGVHVRYCEKTSRLLLYWGESKLYGDVDQAIAAAIKSIGEALDPSKIKHELELVERNIDFAGITAEAKSALLRHLDHRANLFLPQILACFRISSSVMIEPIPIHRGARRDRHERGPGNDRCWPHCGTLSAHRCRENRMSV